MKSIILCLFYSSLLFISCGKDPNPTVVYPNDSTTTITRQRLELDTSLVIASGLPIHFDSTDYLLFPTGPVKFYGRGSKLDILSSSSTGGSSYSVGYLSHTTFQGDIDNIMIQKLGSNDFAPISEDILKIRSFRFLSSIQKSTKKQLLLLLVTDRDTNNDAVLNNQDLESLYLYDLEKTQLLKLSPNLHKLIDWKTLKINNRIYFRTIEDLDKNGKFDEKDKIHYYYVDLQGSELSTNEYFPI